MNSLKRRWTIFWMRRSVWSLGDVCACGLRVGDSLPATARRHLARNGPVGYISAKAQLYGQDISVASGCFVDDDVVIFQHPSGGPVRLAACVHLYRGCIIETGPGGSLTVGHDTPTSNPAANLRRLPVRSGSANGYRSPPTARFIRTIIALRRGRRSAISLCAPRAASLSRTAPGWASASLYWTASRSARAWSWAQGRSSRRAYPPMLLPSACRRKSWESAARLPPAPDEQRGSGARDAASNKAADRPTHSAISGPMSAPRRIAALSARLYHAR